MRPRFVIFLFVLVAMVFSVAFWLRPKQPPIKTRPASTAQTQANALATQSTTANIVSQISNPSQTTVTQINSEPFITNNTKALTIASQFVAERNQPVEFYGRVIDQDSNSLSGAKVKISILHLHMPNPLVPPSRNTKQRNTAWTLAEKRNRLKKRTHPVPRMTNPRLGS